MAIKTDAELKSTVAENKLTSELMNNIIDSKPNVDNIILDHNDTENIQGGSVGEYNHLDNEGLINSQVWVKEGTDAVLYSGATELMRVKAGGNIAYNGASIPNDLNSSVEYIFRDDNCEAVLGSTKFGCTGCYPNSGASQYTSKIAGIITILIQSGAGYSHYTYTATLGEDVALTSFTKTVIV